MNPFADFHRTEMTDQQIIDEAYAKKYNEQQQKKMENMSEKEQIELLKTLF